MAWERRAVLLCPERHRKEIRAAAFLEGSRSLISLSQVWFSLSVSQSLLISIKIEATYQKIPIIGNKQKNQTGTEAKLQY